MKIPFLNIWVTRKDWQEMHFKLGNKYQDISIKYLHCLLDMVQLNKVLEKYKQPRNPDGTFKSKKKDLHDQLRAEVKQAQAIVSNGSSCIGHYDDVRKASKI